MKITVAIPAYNKENYIEDCIRSVLHEKTDLEEILLIDNCSTDKTLELSKKFEPNIRCIKNETNLGMAGNWNKCIDTCNNEWLMIVHADDELLPNSIEKYKKIIEKNPSIALIHAASFSKINGQLSPYLEKPLKKDFWLAGTEALSCEYGVCSAVMVRKDVYTSLGYFIESQSSDVEMWARIASKYDVGYINEPTVIFHVNPTSTGHESLTKRTVSEIKADWDQLDVKIAESYPTKEAQEKFLVTSFKNGPYNYWSVVKANIREQNYIKALKAMWLIVTFYKGFFVLLKIIFTTTWKQLKKQLSK